MFQVGRKYKDKLSDYICECVFVGNTRAILRPEGGGEEIAPYLRATNNRERWEEFFPPVKLKATIVKENKTGKINLYRSYNSDKIGYDNGVRTVIDIIEITYQPS